MQNLDKKYLVCVKRLLSYLTNTVKLSVTLRQTHFISSNVD